MPEITVWWVKRERNKEGQQAESTERVEAERVWNGLEKSEKEDTQGNQAGSKDSRRDGMTLKASVI